MQSPHRQQRFPIVLVSLALAWCALAGWSTAWSLDNSATPFGGLLYLPFAARPIPTPTPTPTPTVTPTPTPTPVPPDIRIDPSCCNFRGGSAQDPTGEVVCFRSYDGRSITMTGWLVKDRVRLRYTFPTFVLQPGAVVTLHSGQGRNTATDLYSGSGLIWNNDHDTVFLCDTPDHVLDSYNY